MIYLKMNKTQEVGKMLISSNPGLADGGSADSESMPASVSSITTSSLKEAKIFHLLMNLHREFWPPDSLKSYFWKKRFDDSH